VAIVVAESKYTAADAAELVEIDYEPLKPVSTIEQALSPEAPQIHDGYERDIAWKKRYVYGDVENDFFEGGTHSKGQVLLPQIHLVTTGADGARCLL
jgi:2-furoyl-CoA dehydrogenase large subunit